MNRTGSTILTRCEMGAAIFLTVILVALHAVFLFHAGPLWRDEISSLGLATKPTFPEFWRSLVFDPFPAGYFFVVRFWNLIGLGQSDFALRVLGFLVGLSLIGALWAGSYSFDRSPPVWPLALFAFNPLTLEVGDSLRPYGFSLIWTVLAFALISRITFRENNKSVVLSTLVVTVLSLQSAFTNALILFAFLAGACAVLVRKKDWRTLGILFGIGGIAALLVAPYLPVVRQTAQWSAILAHENDLSSVLAVGGDAIRGSGAFTKWIWLILMGATISAPIVMLISPKRAANDVDLPRERIVFAGVILFVAIAVTIGFLSAAKYLVFPRYFLGALCIAALCINAAWTAIRGKLAIRTLGLCLALTVAVISFRPLFARARMRMTNCDRIATVLEQRATGDDLIIVTSPLYGITFQRYYHGQTDWVTLPQVEDFTLHRWDLLKRTLAEADPVPQLVSRAQRVLQSGHRIFLVGKLGPAPATQPESPPPAPQSQFDWQFEAYTAQWKSELTYWIEHHGLHGTNLAIDGSANVNWFEELGLFEVSGWRGP